MPSSVNQSQEKRGINWLAVVRILLVQVLVLIAISGAIIGYLNWSSDAAWGEFNGESKSSASDAGGTASPPPVHAVRNQTPCIRAS